MNASDRATNIFLTGGTGLLGKRLLARLAARPGATVYALCRKSSENLSRNSVGSNSFERTACKEARNNARINSHPQQGLMPERQDRFSEARLHQLLPNNPELKAKVRIVQGDVTLPNLGVAPEIVEELSQHCVEIFHCAAAYDLAVEREKALRVNTEGTRKTLDFAASLKSLRRFHHISTIIVSGDRTGEIYENELDKGQGFKNFYELSKFHAEKEVVKYSGRIPVTVYRPAVIVGDSRDGSIDKFDGPYFALGFMLRGLPMLIPGSGPVNAMRLLAALPLFSRITTIPAQTIPYMYQETKYDMTNTAEVLQRSGIQCPPIEGYLGRILQFFTMNYGRPIADAVANSGTR
ncbi:MAG: SDR family oxidoreductase [Candidatus Lindowbacteria bacterium]|nr:SDR family oxidoreductase [Candidatus Lindowbacteria bacterium]